MALEDLPEGDLSELECEVDLEALTPEEREAYFEALEAGDDLAILSAWELFGGNAGK